MTIAAVGRLKTGPERELYLRYADRIGRSGRALALGPVDLVEIAEDRASAAAQRMHAEGRLLLERTANSGRRVVMDERGRALSSMEFSDYVRDARDNGTERIAFLFGGADGHDAAVRDAADLILSLGPMTLPHGLARVVLAEQIYRALTLIAGHPYHRE
jgi:23S rRNA (pseudouridine1915-N3)-methyltransferase